MRVNKTSVYRSAPENSFLNTEERGIAISNLALANHGVFFYPNASKWLLELFHGYRSMKAVREVIEIYYIELELAKEFKKQYPLLAIHDDDDDFSVESNMIEEEDDDDVLNDMEVNDANEYFPATPKKGEK